MATLTMRPTGYRVDLRPAAASAIPERTRRLLIERLQAGATIVVEHVERHKLIYRIGAITIMVLLGAGGLHQVFAASDASGLVLDVGAQKLYHKLISIGKWVIIIKGAFDTIQATVQGDFVQARKSGLAYLMVYAILLGLPWAFGQVELLFEGM
ncbi:hypothetical protein [Paenibacillus sp. P22]|uniref:hypothetical protein n=1 Tax=Paenibacillus sp. P22 TaxID=483908 RepID=UPI000430941D|nr:hypothetical protein [Paenibacillus sp. P22]CDN41703.1 Putative uncharacterized protein [Paenibacillus sp. P22]